MPRKPYGKFFEVVLLSCLDATIPRTSEAIRKMVAEKLDKPGISWHTIRKYLNFLRDAQKVEEVHVGKTIVYKLKK